MILSSNLLKLGPYRGRDEAIKVNLPRFCGLNCG